MVRLIVFVMVCGPCVALVKLDSNPTVNGRTTVPNELSSDAVDVFDPEPLDPESERTMLHADNVQDEEPPTEFNMIYDSSSARQEDLVAIPLRLSEENAELKMRLLMMEKHRSMDELRLTDLQKQLADVRQRLNRTVHDLVSEKEISRIRDNSNSAMTLENQQIGNNLNKEKVKTRQLKAQIAEYSRLYNGSLHNNQSEDLDAWDVHETVWNGDRWLQNWDNREPKGHTENVTASRIFLFIRHGHYEYSIPETLIEMSELGKQQMEWAGRGLAMLNYPWYKTFVHSSKRRTQQAAEIVARYLPKNLTLEPSDLIWSCAFENDSLRRQIAFKHYIHRAPPTQKSTSYELFVTHSSIIRYFVERALQVPQDTLSLPLVHGSITRMEVQGDGRAFLREFGEYSHMPRPLITTSNAKWSNNEPIFANPTNWTALPG